MNRLRLLKAALVAVWVVGMLLLFGAGGRFFSSTAAPDGQKKQPAAQPAAVVNPDDYVGSDTCATCHTERHADFLKTAHAKLEQDKSWKGKVTGCESCHGPGKAHVEGGGDKTKIRTFEGETSKQISETCTTCHAGREEHSNFLRGEHWRNDVGCTDCHSTHGESPAGKNSAGSNSFVGGANAEKQGFETAKMLKGTEQQLCLKCHAEQKHQFTQPFHHKVLEGAMKCSDCHNPHGGFEQKQTRLSTGADAACVKCHSDKQGPFAYEHAPVKTEGCASCHTPHGSSNPRMLRTSNVAQLCLECHSTAHGVGATAPTGPAKNLYLQYRDCTVCHTKVHGSHTSPVFFR
ncbi:MAG TPA: DmsE family decaheme c-type cytochrome [Pyrinomonadaceae bacterium]|nr:DmsE family decaheme c-type cytochrome [Pyrinomonadaceae bacterium]